MNQIPRKLNFRGKLYRIYDQMYNEIEGEIDPNAFYLLDLQNNEMHNEIQMYFHVLPPIEDWTKTYLTPFAHELIVHNYEYARQLIGKLDHHIGIINFSNGIYRAGVIYDLIGCIFDSRPTDRREIFLCLNSQKNINNIYIANIIIKFGKSKTLKETLTECVECIKNIDFEDTDELLSHCAELLSLKNTETYKEYANIFACLLFLGCKSIRKDGKKWSSFLDPNISIQILEDIPDLLLELFKYTNSQKVKRCV